MKLVRGLAVGSFLLTVASLAGGEPIPPVDMTIAGFLGMASNGPLDEPTWITSMAEFEATFGAGTDGLSNPFLAPSVAAFFANGGTQLSVVRVAADDDASFIGVDGGAGARTGLQTFLDVDEVALLAIPGATSLAVQTAMIEHCESMGDRMAVLDPASWDDVDAVLAQRASLSSVYGHAALYFPWVQAEPTGLSLLLPPSGFVAGVYARTSPPDSPVGSIATATGVSLVLSTQQSDVLNQAGVNPIRLFSGPDVRIWGARTIASDPEWKYVVVRRISLFLQESIHDGTEWALWEPNDEGLWALLREDVGDFLFELWQAGWFPGPTPDSAFFVRVDETTMTEQDIEEGRTIILVGFAPLQPSEFLLLWIVHQREQGASTPPAGLTPRLLSAVPNPFRDQTTIEFDLPHAERARLCIYDSHGRLVRTLIEGDLLTGGARTSVWDGRDDRGRPVASGVYMSRLETWSLERTARVLAVH